MAVVNVALCFIQSVVTSVYIYVCNVFSDRILQHLDTLFIQWSETTLPLPQSNIGTENYTLRNEHRAIPAQNYSGFQEFSSVPLYSRNFILQERGIITKTSVNDRNSFRNNKENIYIKKMAVNKLKINVAI